MNMPVIPSQHYELPPLPEEPEEPEEPDTPVVPDDPVTPPASKYVYVGTLSLPKLGIGSMNQITAEHIETLEKLSDGVYTRKPVVATQYDIIVVAVPTTRTVYVDDGLSNKTAFYTNYTDVDGMPFYANGEIFCEVGDETYAIYGVLTAISGTNYIYIE